MKAYRAWDSQAVENYSTVVFANTAQEAKKVAFSTETCEDAKYTDIRVRRFPEMDDHDKGRSEIDWYDMEDRRALVALGWSCLEMSWECDTCECKDICDQWEGEECGQL